MSNPTAVLFQALPPLAPDEYRALEQSIESHGIQVPVVVDENGVVIDGHHRQKIANHLGLECPTIIKSGYTDAEKRTLALSLNIDRRQLNREQKRALIAESIKADPQLSDREHAKRTGSSHPTVGDVRNELEAKGDVENLSTRTDSIGRVQPSSKPRPTIDPEDPAIDGDISSEQESRDEVFPGLTSDELDELNPPTPIPDQSQKQKRKPLVDQAREVSLDLARLTKRLQAVSNDDRLIKNKDQVASQLRYNLAQVIEVCQDLNQKINQLEPIQ